MASKRLHFISLRMRVYTLGISTYLAHSRVFLAPV